MSDRLALLRGILANPDDDLRRLVYADWLDDHGTTDADKARAEFIRLGCKMKAKEAITPKEGKWLDANWRLLLPNLVASLPNSDRAELKRDGRELAIVVTGGKGWPVRRAVVRLRYFRGRGFATDISFANRTVYEACWRNAAGDEPIAQFAGFPGPIDFLGTPGHGRVVAIPRHQLTPDLWGEALFDRITEHDEADANEKRFIDRPKRPTDPPYADPSHRMYLAIAAAMTAIAREYTGLTPAPEA